MAQGRGAPGLPFPRCAERLGGSAAIGGCALVLELPVPTVSDKPRWTGRSRRHHGHGVGRAAAAPSIVQGCHCGDGGGGGGYAHPHWWLVLEDFGHAGHGQAVAQQRLSGDATPASLCHGEEPPRIAPTLWAPLLRVRRRREGSYQASTRHRGPSAGLGTHSATWVQASHRAGPALRGAGR